MTTQELKQQIDKVLGNSIRCLLPSYWWKRLFSLTLEKVDEKLDATNIKTINGEPIVGEGNLKVGVTTVGSIDELNTLEASVGDIATVGEESAMLVSGGDLQQVDDAHEVLEKWDNLTRIVKVEFGEPVNATVYLNGKKPYTYDTIIITSIEGEFYCAHIVAGAMKIITIEEVNERLKKHDYRFMMGSNGDVIDRAFKLHAYSASADAYIKSDSWDKLSKEYIVSSEEELNTLSVGNGTIAKVARELKQINRANCHTVIKFSDIPANWDKFTRVDKVERIGGNTSNSCGINLAHYDGHAYVVLRINFVGHMTYVASVYVDSTLTNEVSITKTEVDIKLQEYDFRYIGPTFISGEPYIDSTFILYEKDVSADAYIKGETWTRLLKEGDVVGGGPEILELTFGETEEDRANNVKIYNKIVEAFNSGGINMPMISVGGMLVSNVTLSVSEGETTAYLNFIADYISFKAIASLSFTKTGEVEVEEELEYSSYYHIRSASSMVNFAKCVAAGLLPNVLYTDTRQGLVIADTFNSEGDNIVLYFNLSKGRTKVVVSSETGEILSEEVVSSGADSTFVLDFTVDEIEEAISNNGGVIDYTLNRELIIDALSKNIPMVVRIGEHSNGYCLAQGELDGADTLTITFNHSQYKYSILIGDESIEVDRSSSISALEARLAALEAKLS